MKQGRTLEELGKELERQRQATRAFARIRGRGPFDGQRHGVVITEHELLQMKKELRSVSISMATNSSMGLQS